MKSVALSIVWACSCTAAIGNFRVLGTTATQALIAYTAPDGNACTIQVSQSAGLTPPALDVDPGTFANSNSDLSRPSTVTSGLSRMVVLGQRTAQYATAGTYSGVRHYSRALEAYKPYYGKITCPSTGDTQTFTFTTGNIPLGQTYGDPWLSDTSHPGDQPWPEWLGGLTPESFIDPLTGVNEYRIGLRGNVPTVWNLAFGSAFNQGQTTPCDSAGPWASPCNVTAGSGSATVGNSTARLVLRPSLAVVNSPWNTNYNSGFSIEELGASLTGYVNSTTASFRNLDFCLSLNGGATCASGIRQIAMGQTSGSVTVGAAPTSMWVPSQFGVDPWVLDTNPRLNSQETSPHSGRATVTNNAGTYTVTNTSGDPFSLYWITGGAGTIRLSTTNDACTTPPASTTSAEYRMASFTDGNNLVLASGGTPPTGTGVYWCADNFAILVWRDQLPTDGSTVTLTAATLNVLGSYSPAYSDNGAGTACFNKPVYGGYFCLYGGMYWINPSGPSVAYFGTPIAAGLDGSGNPITNSWTRVSAPTPESSAINQTANDFTFYVIGGDPGSTPAGAPVIIRGVFTPTATPVQPTTPQSGVGIAQIANAHVTGTDAYSVTWSVSTPSPWSMTWTNLSPQTTPTTCLGVSGAGCGIVQQMATFDPTFIPSYFNQTSTGGWNCNLTGAASLGMLFFTCLSGAGDSPGWIFAFSPGDGIAAHAGQPGGPQINGAINTFNTPNGPVSAGQAAMTGRTLHGIAETGETGWLSITTSLNYSSQWVPVTTSANTSGIPASGSATSCSAYGLPSGHDCVSIQMKSYTAHSVTGYEPYLASPGSPWLGTPGEERTTQLGDTVCVTSGASCSYIGAPPANELMTLVAKNYGGTPGLWVFQRSSNGVELPIAASTPITLWWESIMVSIPATSGNQSLNTTEYWNPLKGCAGSPDPHGNCLMQDTNFAEAHGEWRDGGEAVGVNVPNWAVPSSAVGIGVPWPTDYQTVVGSVPGILSLTPANLTPGAAAGVNFVSGSPPFAGAFGVPFQPDGGTHPNPPGANASAYEALEAFDNTPLQGGTYEPAFTLVSGQLYDYIPSTVKDSDDFYSATGGSGGYGVTTINRKLMATGASCGSHPLIDISSPATGNAIATDTTASYEYCVARNANECRSGSSQGEIFVNCPGVVWPRCEGLSIHGGVPLGVGNDICVGNVSKVADAIIQFTLAHTDYFDAYTRILASATSRRRMVSGFENNRLLPDNSWILYRQEYLNYQRQEMWMAKLPPYPAVDSINRGAFVPMLINKLQGPPGTDNAIVEFGHQEYGAPQQVNCTTRNDVCLATASTVPAGTQPFYFASENPAGAPCATGCTITIPAISQRILYYRVKYRNASNTVLAASPLTAVVVP